MSGPSWGELLVGQLDFYWQVHLRPRLDGLTDEEYHWEPVPGCWGVRERDGRWTLDQTDPTPDPAPVTTIAWRIVHIAAYNIAARTSTFFGGQVDAPMNDPRHVPADLPGTAADAIAFLERHYDAWRNALSALDDEALQRPLGRKGGFFAKDSMAALIVHVNRESIHHGGEIGVLRDLYRARSGPGSAPPPPG